ncbi:hypothetical protein [Pseudoteredinibacter isoporae]|uniref:Uncharacterized protein n=1 Tax=Pseudoteredinibacter isoporae TaxID=570281 RepID=A0A7X0JTD6_9GAMM|nr:hypothetical protein [Pseudoteredinibacter isoporae]MBB6521036.1 hypothetical protein [Pseudoteredinibacter isoporae]NHO86600.1 hypothetical protein [Pseudoteredinibacter isoporae]NIB24948.1 hypothetical protein [Pseudoteredinibacter isoporae]
MKIGIYRQTGQVFEGDTYHGREVNSPIISPCKLVTSREELKVGPNTSHDTEGYVFREDFYDPKSRIRRGRIYSAWNSQPHRWIGLNGESPKELITYAKSSVWAQYHQQGQKEVYALLGDERRFGVWRLVDIEVMATGEELLTLKALSVYGLLPELLEAEIPEEQLSLIKRKLSIVVDDMYTASAESVVDCCREAATAVLGSYLCLPGSDLGSLCKQLGEQKKYIAKDLSNTINLFHTRRKTSGERGRGTRRITDEDAHLAVSALGVVLVELGWGRW